MFVGFNILEPALSEAVLCCSTRVLTRLLLVSSCMALRLFALRESYERCCNLAASKPWRRRALEWKTGRQLNGSPTIRLLLVDPQMVPELN